MKLLILVVISICLVGCGSKKVIVKACEKAENTDLFICEKM